MCRGRCCRAIRHAPLNGSVYVSTAALLAVLLTVPATAHASEDDGLFLGERYRWAQMGVVSRVLYDVVAIPGNVGRWQAMDWAQFALWSGAVGGLMFGGRPSPDVRLDQWSAAHLDSRLPAVWLVPHEAALWGTLAVGGIGTWAWASLNRRDDVAQGLSLMGEAVAVSQIYHLALKFALGREGPTDGAGDAVILGPANAIRVYPSGTPSGHAATLFSLVSAGFAYFRPPAWAQVIGYVLVGGLVAFHVIEHNHFLSDSLWGSAMGWYIGQWVVRHRASWLFGERGAARLSIAPMASRGVNSLVIRVAF